VVLLLLPAAALALTFLLYPIATTLWLSIHDVDEFGRLLGFTGFDNYVALWQDPAFRGSLVRTVMWTIGTVAITTILSLYLAVVLNEHFPGRAIVRSLLMLPWSASLVITTLLWRWLAHPDFGAVNHLLHSVGLTQARIDWLANPDLSFPLMIWIAVWVSIPSTTLMLLAGLQSVLPDIYEAAALDGARGLRRFLDFTLPLLRPILAVSILLNVIFVFNSFPIIWVLTQGGPAGATDTLVTYLYRLGFTYYQMGQAAAVSVIIFLILLIFAIIHTRLLWDDVIA
jgi:multiple sugar transport system permease protein